MKLQHIISEEVVDEVEYENGEPGKSYSFNGEKWIWVCRATPGEKNTFSGYDGETTLRLNEVFPEKNDSHDEYVEIYNFGEKSVNLFGWELRDASKSFVMKNEGDALSSGKFLILPKEKTKIALNNDREDIYLKDPCGGERDAFSYTSSSKTKNWSFNGEDWEETANFTPGKENIFKVNEDENKQEDDIKNATIRINEVQFTGGPGKTKQDFVELYNFGDEVVDMGKWRLRKKTSSGKEYSLKVFDEETLLKPGEFYVWANSNDDFDENIDADSKSTATLSEENTVFIQDSEENEVDSVEIPKSDALALALDDEGNWREIFTSTPGEENIFEKEQDISQTKIRFSEIFPDPVLVTDSEGEFVEIENYGDEKIDLSLWRIVVTDRVTGEKKEQKSLSGFLDAGEFALFDTISLRNTDGQKMELRHISGEIIDEMSYEKAEPGKPYAFDGDVWVWTCKETPKEKNDFSGYDGAVTLKITEVFPQKNDIYDEYIELYNFGKEDVESTRWSVQDASTTFTFGVDSKSIAPGEFLVLSKERSRIALNNNGDTIKLLDPCSQERDGFVYETSSAIKSWSLEEDVFKGTPYFTPGKKNIFPEKVKNPTVEIHEVLPNPSGEEASDEYIELYNFGKSSQDISYWTIEDASGKIFAFPKNTLLRAQEYSVVYRKDFSFALNNSNETIILRDASGQKIDSMQYKTSKEDLSWNNDDGKWRKSDTLTPGEENEYNNLPRIVDFDVPDDVYKNVKAFFYVRVEDTDDDDISYRWEFGDGKKSYKEDTTHTYEKKDSFELTLRVSDGIEEISKTEKIKVKKYPRYDISIKSFVPNPIGKDTENEWVEVCNNEDEEIDIRSWSIASGKNKESLTNHPLRGRVQLKPQECKRITRQLCALSLNNTQGIIELRSADGSSIETVFYTKDKIQEGDVYKKSEDGVWFWGEVFSQEKVLQSFATPSNQNFQEREVLGSSSQKNNVPADIKELFFTSFEENLLKYFPSLFLEKREKKFLFTRRGIVSKQYSWKRCLWGLCQE